MKEEELIKKWLRDELTPEELKAFKSLDAYSSYAKLSEKAKHFQAPDFDQEKSLNELNSSLNSKQNSSKTSALKYLIALAAVFIIVFSAVNILNSASDLESFKTDIAKTELVDLPDQSSVKLNANSSLSYSSSNWENNRKLNLDGEAYFKVESGKTFIVNTDYGTVEVLGTQFNVKSRSYGFEVSCYEGAVQVIVGGETYTLQANDALKLKNDEVVMIQSHSSTPDWTREASILKSLPLEQVLKEFQNFYDVEFETNTIDTSRLYTGSFTHNNIKNALKSITLPLGLTYRIEDKKVILSNK